MLTPEYLGSCTDYLLALYDGLEEQILQDMARRIVKTGELTETANWQYKQLQEMGALQDFIYERLAEISGKSDAEIRRLFEESAYQNITTNVAPLISHGIAVEMGLSAPMRQILEANIIRTSGNIKNLTRTIGSTGSMTYYDISNQAFMQAMSGAFSPDYAIREAIRRLGGSGVTVMFPGRKDKLDVAIRRNVRTSVAQTAATITMMQALQMGVQYYETTAHIGARPEHAVWQGRVFKIEGSDPDHENFYDATQYGTAGGLCGVNCRHQFFPFWPGISKPAYSKETLDHYNNATVTYNGEEIPYYVATQMQRAMERGIRESKRSVIVADAAREEAADEAIKGALDEEFNHQSSILKKREKGLKDFLGQTGLSADGSRTNVVGFGRSVSQKAVWANRRLLSSNPFASEGESDTIKLPDTIIIKSLSARAKNYDVEDKSTGDTYRFAEGTRIQDSEVFAGYKTRHPLDEEVARGLSEQIGGKPDRWQHCKGIGIIDMDGEHVKAEVHWFQEESVGKHKFKIKQWLDDES